ncbi:hypothetical protein WA158_007274 [Blastocystis sp. Blastoise]
MPLHFHHGQFKIMQMTDLHIGDDQEKDDLTEIQMRNLIEFEKPDLVVVTGDFIAGTAWNHTKGWFKSKWIQATRPFETMKVPYVYLLGNHDDEGELNRKEIITLDMQNKYSLTQIGPEECLGAGNFFLPLYGSTNMTKVVSTLWFFDSMGYDCNGIKGYGCVSNSTVNWYLKESYRLQHVHGLTPGLAFQHIATRQFMDAWNKPEYIKLGEKHEVTGCSSSESGEYDAFVYRNEINGLFVGHDHVNDYITNYNGIYLAYGMKTGFGGYGPCSWKERGVRMIILNEQFPREWSTYIQTESNKRIDQINMNWRNGTQFKCDLEA